MMQDCLTQPSNFTTQRLPGAPLRDALLGQIRTVLAAQGQAPTLVIVQVGEHGPSAAYIRHKLAACEQVGIKAEVRRLPATAREADLHTLLQRLGDDERVHAIVAQTPLPAGWDVQAALNLVPALKDCDGLCLYNREKFAEDAASTLLAATPLGVLRLLTHPTLGAGVTLRGQTVAVIGNGLVVGRPLRALLARQGAVVLGIDVDTRDPAESCRWADVVCSAAGAAGLVTRQWLKPGAVVVDIGLSTVMVDGAAKLRGDVKAADVQGVAKVLTPVPGGVGPLTVASLLTNVVDGWLMQQGQARVNWA